MDISQPNSIRLDQYLSDKEPGSSRNQLSKLISSGQVSVNGQVVNKSGFKLKSKDKVSYVLKENKQNLKKLTPKILYEDEDCVVIEKPLGILSHSKGDYLDEETVASWLSSKIQDIEGNRAGIVHRLDRGTSGVMICAKNLETQKWLQKQFSTRKTKKTYIAVVEGKLNPENAIVDMAIERNPKKPQTFRVGINGKSAITKYETIKSNDKYSLIRLTPLTGRTHQLRVHLANLNHPIYGDDLYGASKADRLYLHANKLELTLNNRKRMEFVSKVPASFNKIFK